MRNKISVITVVFNDVAHIKETMESYFSQTWEEKEYIVIDGGSTDGTADIISKYADRLAYWCSEPDGGIFDAMNKGIKYAEGDWINILNSGDLYASPHSLEQAIRRAPDIEHADILFGNSIERSEENGDVFKRTSDFNLMEYGPIYRHGSSLVRAKVHKDHLFHIEQQSKYGYALDWLLIYELYKKGFHFQKTEATIEIYQLDGTSYGYEQNLKYNRMIITGKALTMTDKIFIKKTILKEAFKQSILYRWMIAFLTEYTLNDILPHIPFWTVRNFWMRCLKMKIGKGTFVMKRVYIMTPQQLTIGQYSHINRGCLLTPAVESSLATMFLFRITSVSCLAAMTTILKNSAGAFCQSRLKIMYGLVIMLSSFKMLRLEREQLSVLVLLSQGMSSHIAWLPAFLHAK